MHPDGAARDTFGLVTQPPPVPMTAHDPIRVCAVCLSGGADRGHARQAGPNRDMCSLCYLGAPAVDKALDDWLAANGGHAQDTEPIDCLEVWWAFYEFHGMRS